ncbi:MAG TPA: hypothetical protein VF585_01615 [Chthoniobacterales bacterium]|jgi:CheY-like chemotaxis protein
MPQQFDVFEPGDQTALVAFDEARYAEVVSKQLTAIDYKVHGTDSYEELMIQVKTHQYDLVLIQADYAGWAIEENEILQAITKLPAEIRRNEYVMLMGNNLPTNDEMLAFIYSVDLVFDFADMPTFKSVLRRGKARHYDFYYNFREACKAPRG